MIKKEIFMVTGGQSGDYARLAILSLFENCRDHFSFTVLTDEPADKALYTAILNEADPDGKVEKHVYDMDDCNARADVYFADFPNVRDFHYGHPCWRKITDPSLFATEGAEIIVLDPDIYFPSEFVFENTPDGKLILMRQHRHCLLPAETVIATFDAGIRLAHHTDIGVAQHTTLPWKWIDETLARMGGKSLPRKAHIESILWAAIGMKTGGGYLDGHVWTCWERTPVKRVLMMLGLRDYRLLKIEPIGRMKCFHGSSGAKDWLVKAHAAGIFKKSSPKLTQTPIAPFVEITREEFVRGEARKKIYHNSLAYLGLSDPLSSAK